MATIFESLNTQINGTNTIFTTSASLDDGYIPIYNGQSINGFATQLTSNSFELTFAPQLVPAPQDTLGIFVNPTVYDITSQIDGSKTIFTKDASDIELGNFLAILNGQFKPNDTVTINPNTFSLSPPPQVGDKLEYIRVASVVSILECTLPLTGIVTTDTQIKGKILSPEINGSVNNSKLVKGTVSNITKVTGKVGISTSINGIVDCD